MKVLNDTELKALLTKLKSKFALANHTHTGYANSTHSHSVVSTTAAGFAPQRSNTTTKFLRDDGIWAVPPDTKVTVDKDIDNISSNPVANYVIDAALATKADNKLATSSTSGLMSAADKKWIDCVMGLDCVQSGSCSHAEGEGSSAVGDFSHAEGCSTQAGGQYSHAEGEESMSSGNYSHAEGSFTKAQGTDSHAEGTDTNAKGIGSHAEGFGTIANSYQHVEGCYNIEKTTTGTIFSNVANSLLIVGNGTNTARSNAFRVAMDGKCYGKSVFQASGADYAEYFEWIDGNSENEDRRGLFVALDGENIRIATAEDSEDDIIGVVSATPFVAGDIQSETWKSMYLTDIFGQPITEAVEIEEATDKHGRVIPAHTEVRYIVNPEYDPEQEYISREDRPEWGLVGMIGKLVIIDDGTCKVNGYCKPTEGGIATAVGETSGTTRYRVMARLDDTHIKVLIK